MITRVGLVYLLLCLGVVNLCHKSYGNSDDNNISKELLYFNYNETSNKLFDPNVVSYSLPLNENDIVNIDKIEHIINFDSISDLILRNGFAIVENDPDSKLYDRGFIHIHKPLMDYKIPAFLTSDTALYIYRILLDNVLKDIEVNKLAPDVMNLTKALMTDMLVKYNQLEGDLKEAARRNVAYLSVAQKLLDPDAAVPDSVETEVNSELTKIEAHHGMSDSDIFKYTQDYSQYVPRGHYTKSEILKRYFQTMMWYGSMTFLLKGGSDGIISERDAKIQTLQACMLAVSLKNVIVDNITGLGIWERVYNVMSFFVGFADDLTPKDYLQAIDQIYMNGFGLNDLADDEKLSALKKHLVLLSSPKIYSGIGNITSEERAPNVTLNKVLEITKGMRFIGHRFIPDSYIFQHLTYPQVSRYTGDPNKTPFTKDNFGNRSYIRGLDLMAVLGSNEAKKILTYNGDTDFERYTEQFQKLATEYDSLSVNDWNRNLYWSWLFCLKGLLQQFPEGYPSFMQTQAWQRSRLHTSLASWAQLRHDTILQSKQVYAVPITAVRFPVPPTPPPGYIEPVPVFWERLLKLTQMTSQGLEELNVLTPDARDRLDRLEEFNRQALEIVLKQINQKPLSTEDEKFFESLRSELLSMIRINKWDQFIWTNIVVDVYTNPSESKVIEEAIGKVDTMVVACPLLEDKAFLAVGPVFSYYEFKHPMEDRLTDEEWLKMLESSQKPERPGWYIPLMVQKEGTNK